MNAELVRLMDFEEIFALAEAFRIDRSELSLDELCAAIARELNRD